MLSVLQELAEIPREAEAEAVTVEGLRAENAALKRKLSGQAKAQAGIPETEVKARVAKAVEESERKHQKILQAIMTLAGTAGPAVAISPTPRQSPMPVANKAAPAPTTKEPVSQKHVTGITPPQQRVLDAMARLIPWD